MHSPSTHCRLELEQGIIARFVIGHSANAAAEAALAEEERQHGDFLRLPGLMEGYAGLPAKTLRFLQVSQSSCCCRCVLCQ